MFKRFLLWFNYYNIIQLGNSKFVLRKGWLRYHYYDKTRPSIWLSSGKWGSSNKNIIHHDCMLPSKNEALEILNKIKEENVNFKSRIVY